MPPSQGSSAIHIRGWSPNMARWHKTLWSTKTWLKMKFYYTKGTGWTLFISKIFFLIQWKNGLYEVIKIIPQYVLEGGTKRYLVLDTSILYITFLPITLVSTLPLKRNNFFLFWAQIRRNSENSSGGHIHDVTTKNFYHILWSSIRSSEPQNFFLKILKRG